MDWEWRNKWRRGRGSMMFPEIPWLLIICGVSDWKSLQFSAITAILPYHPSPELIKTHPKLKWCPSQWDELCDSCLSELAPWRITLTLGSFITNLSKKTTYTFHIRFLMKQAQFCSFLRFFMEANSYLQKCKVGCFLSAGLKPGEEPGLTG